MFDDTPSSSASNAVAATNITVLNSGERKGLLYIEDMYDPDKHPIQDKEKYVVPQEMQLVADVPNGVLYYAAYVDWQGTLKTTLKVWNLQTADAGGNTADQDSLFGLRGGPMIGEALLAIDYSVRPNRARVDATIMRPGASHAFVYLGNSAIESNIISAQYDQSLNMISNKVPVKLAEINDKTNKSIMTTGSFSVTANEEKLVEGTRAWLVFFDNDTFIPPAQPLMVQHCAYMKDHEIGIKYVTEVELLSPWFTDTTNPETLLVPVNLPLSQLELRAVVHYSDGSVSDPQVVNGSKFSLYGLAEYQPTWPGQTGELVLTYKLGVDEQHYVANPGSPNHRSRIYNIVAGDAQGAYSPKLYTYPQWDATINGYVLKHWLFDLDRKVRIDVTAKVTLNDMSPAWKPNTYGVTQAMIFNLNLRDVSQSYQSLTFKQHVVLTLLKDVNGVGKRWDVSYSMDMLPFGGFSVLAKNAGTATTINVTNGFANQAAWLTGLYRAVKPSYSTRTEDQAPAPTHFDLMNDAGNKWRFSIADWNKNNPVTVDLQKGRTWYLSWVNVSASGVELQLALTGLVVELSV